MTVSLKRGYLRLRIVTPSMIRVTYSLAKSEPDVKSLSVVGQFKTSAFEASESSDAVVLRTSQLGVHLKKASGSITRA